jgi:hypothetical protein
MNNDGQAFGPNHLFDPAARDGQQAGPCPAW